MKMKGKHVILGITGSIAAYKAAALARLFVKNGAEVRIVMTPSAKEFITPLTLSSLTGNDVISEFFDKSSGHWHSHVDLGIWADAFVVAPATASTLAKMAYGIADNMLITTYLSNRAKCFAAPAMDLDMFSHPSTVASIGILKQRGCVIIEPETGELASHLIGKGRMAEPETIFACVAEHLSDRKPFSGKKILMTSGPTIEKLDPVRYISNYSSGKMGKNLAEVLAGLGAEVIFVTGPVHELPSHPGISVVKVESAAQMYDAVMLHSSDYDIAVLVAAVADYKAENICNHKIKREKNMEMTIKLVSNPDIAAALGAVKKNNQYIMGFALETENGLNNSMVKIASKNMDAIVINSLEDEGAGFMCDTNKITILSSSGIKEDFGLKSKREVAQDIAEYIRKHFVGMK